MFFFTQPVSSSALIICLETIITLIADQTLKNIALSIIVHDPGLPSYCFIFPTYYFLHYPPQFLHIFHISFISLSYSFIFLQNFGPKGGGEREGLANAIFNLGVEPGIFQVPGRPVIGRNFPHLSSQLAPRLGRFRVIFFISHQHLGPKGGGEEGQISRGEAPEFHIYAGNI